MSVLKQVYNNISPSFQFFELSQDYFLVVDQGGSLIHTNASFNKASGWTAKAFPIKPNQYLAASADPASFLTLSPEDGARSATLTGCEGQTVEATWSVIEQEDYKVYVGIPPKDSLNPQALVDSYQQMAFLLDMYGNMIACNHTALKSLELVSDEKAIVGASLLNFIPKSEQRDYASLIRAGLNGEKKNITRRLNFNFGRDRWLDVNIGPISDKDGRVRQVRLTAQDITERKRAEERFKELEISYRSIFRQLAAGILLYDLDLTLLQANQGISDILGYTSEELVSRGTFDFTHPDDRKRSNLMARKLLHGELDHYSLEKRYIHKNGEVVWCLLTATIVSDLNGKPKHVISVIQNIEKQKRIEEDLRFKKNELDAFVHRASHDLKGPVNSLLALYDVVVAELKGQDQALEYFGHYNKNIRRLHDIIQNLLDLSRIKDIKAHFKPVEIRDIVDESEELLRHLPNYENITFEHKYDLPDQVHSDRTLLSTIIQNLIENAIKYSNPMLQGVVNIHIKHQDGLLTIAVEDNGIGIKEEVQPKIFDMFYRATNQATGSGLGLYLLKNAVDKLEGKIDFESKYGQGTTFTIFLPTEGATHTADALPN
ncbi:MAG TPA: hypothetical protein DCR93_15795 [Cytophagales bacterium]|nr:hypothetical protein [Cytophagales bacterium]